MNKSLEGRVIKAVASKFFVETSNGVMACFARKKLKKDGNILVGDYVVINKYQDAYAIDEVKNRKNELIRPYVSNIDLCFITIAYEPEPDFILVDKVIVNCLQQNIEPILLLNKTDIKNIDLSEYKNIIKIISCSAETGEGIQEILELSKNKTVCFAGQSAVGKSSIINKILDKYEMEVGEISSKIKRGKNTTRHIQIIKLDTVSLIDTCGFSMLETIDIEPNELRLYFDDLEIFRKDCKFNMCLHINEPDCEVKKHVGKEIGLGRYNRYVTIYNELVKRKEELYD